MSLLLVPGMGCVHVGSPELYTQSPFPLPVYSSHALWLGCAASHVPASSWHSDAVCNQAVASLITGS